MMEASDLSSGPPPAATGAPAAGDGPGPTHHPSHGHTHGHSHGSHSCQGHHHPQAHHHDAGTDDAAEQARERHHLQEVVLSFLEYGKYAGAEVERRWQHLCKLPPPLAAALPPESLAPSLHRQRAAVCTNMAFLEAVVQGVEDIGASDDGGSMLDAATALLDRHAQSRASLTIPANIAKIKATLHSCFREWSAAGRPERDACFGPLLAELTQHLEPTDSTSGRKHRVLVPGAGLGRLPLEIAARGYACQGNEFSYHMLLTSNFLLNATAAAEAIPIYPFLDQTCNLWTRAGNITKVLIPDVCPGELLGIGEDGTLVGPPDRPPPDLSMTAGDFILAYGAQVGVWDAVVTCFFLDTASVVIEYVALIHRLLRPGGVWLNMGPLLYHWASGGTGDERYDRSIELAWEEVRHVMVAGYGFELLKEEKRQDVTYAANPGSMMRTVYDCVLFTARKPPKQEGGDDGTGQA